MSLCIVSDCTLVVHCPPSATYTLGLCHMKAENGKNGKYHKCWGKGFLAKGKEEKSRAICDHLHVTWNSSTPHHGHRTTREKWTVKWFCTVACLTIVVVCSHPILKSLILHNTVNSSTTLTVPSTSVGINIETVCKWEVTIQVLKHKFSGQQQKCCNPSCSWSGQSWPSTF